MSLMGFILNFLILNGGNSKNFILNWINDFLLNNYKMEEQNF